jgi:hypothetical protein
MLSLDPDSVRPFERSPSTVCRLVDKDHRRMPRRWIVSAALQKGFIRSWNDDTSEESRTLRRWSTPYSRHGFHLDHLNPVICG